MPLDSAEDGGPGQLTWSSCTGLGEGPDVFAIDQLDADRAESVEVVVPGRLPSMGSVDTWKDDHGNRSNALAEHGQRLVVSDAESKSHGAARRRRVRVGLVWDDLDRVRPWEAGFALNYGTKPGVQLAVSPPIERVLATAEAAMWRAKGSAMEDFVAAFDALTPGDLYLDRAAVFLAEEAIRHSAPSDTCSKALEQHRASLLWRGPARRGSKRAG